MSQPQSYANHARFEPLYHFVAFPILLINFFWSLYDLSGGITAASLRALAVAAALVLVTFFARTFPLKAQDRIIRLEMRQRLHQVLPVELRGRVGEFTPTQLVALRFASDRELPDLAARVLNDNIQNGTAIKKMVTVWEADHLRV